VSKRDKQGHKRHQILTRNSVDPNVEVSNLWISASLEIVLQDESACGLVLKTFAYMPSDEGEGYWSTPCLQFKVSPERDGFTGSRELWAQVDDYMEANKDRLDVVMQSFAECFGIRSPRLVRRRTSEFIEIKPSIHQPSLTNAYYTARYSLESADRASKVNLVDPRLRHGFVTLPFPAEGSKFPLMRDPNGTGSDCVDFLGRPVISGITKLLRSGSRVEEMRAAAISVRDVVSARRGTGLLCAADLSGYGAALASNLVTLTIDQESVRSAFRRQAFGEIESVLAALGTSEVQTAGDGFIAAYPVDPETTDERAALRYALDRWDECVSRIEAGINAQMLQSEETAPRVVGSRLALLSGEYYFGKLNGLKSSFPSFDGGSVIEVARLEQGLRSLVASGKLSGSSDERSARSSHFAVVPGYSRIEEIDALLKSAWDDLGTVSISQKEFVRDNVLLLRRRG
jgi:hypothetical protein